MPNAAKPSFYGSACAAFPFSTKKQDTLDRPGALRAEGDLFTQRTERSGSSTRAATCTCTAGISLARSRRSLWLAGVGLV